MKILGWCGIHYPHEFEYIAVMVEDKGIKITVHVNNPSSNKWVLSESEIRRQAIKLASK
jgi:hypothetical protein